MPDPKKIAPAFGGRTSASLGKNDPRRRRNDDTSLLNAVRPPLKVETNGDIVLDLGTLAAPPSGGTLADLETWAQDLYTQLGGN